MAKTFISLSIDEFNKRIQNRDIEISRAIVNSIIKNLYSTKTNIHIISVEIEEDCEVYDLTLEKKNFISALNENLTNFEQIEDFETCQLIKETIEKLNEQKQSITNI